jgi:hypothetical protein
MPVPPQTECLNRNGYRDVRESRTCATDSELTNSAHSSPCGPPSRSSKNLARCEDPLVELGTADAERVLAVLVRPGCVAVE